MFLNREQTTQTTEEVIRWEDMAEGPAAATHSLTKTSITVEEASIWEEALEASKEELEDSEQASSKATDTWVLNPNFRKE
jgi:hypothetical protein